MIIRAVLFCKSFNRLTQPSVTFEMIYAIDSRPYGFYPFKSRKRLNVQQTLFGQTVGFQMRTFRFNSDENSRTDAQQQTVACHLHLEPTDDIFRRQAADCSCHTVEECQDNCQGYI